LVCSWSTFLLALPLEHAPDIVGEGPLSAFLAARPVTRRQAAAAREPLVKDYFPAGEIKRVGRERGQAMKGLWHHIPPKDD
jgi:hypothetical protein